MNFLPLCIGFSGYDLWEKSLPLREVESEHEITSLFYGISIILIVDRIGVENLAAFEFLICSPLIKDMVTVIYTIPSVTSTLYRGEWIGHFYDMRQSM